MRILFCAKCGANLADGASFCPQCGWRASNTQAGSRSRTADAVSGRPSQQLQRAGSGYGAQATQNGSASGLSQNTKIAVIAGVVGFLVLAIIGIFIRNTPLLVIGSFGFMAALVAMGYLSKKQLTDSGRIIKREGQWWKDEEAFKTNATCSDVLAAMKSIDVSGSGATVSWNSDGSLYRFKAAQWEACMTYEESGAFVFSFLSWKTSNGVNVNSDAMNIVLTAVEKLFLEIDPNVAVQTSRGKYKSKVNFF